jgi:pimeloyl-ACP methyl ester carboxylesterase
VSEWSRNRHVRRLLQFVILSAAIAHAAVYQFSVPVGARRAYLWVPPECKQVRGVAIAMSSLLERTVLEDPIIREAATAECLGEVWIGPLPEGAQAPFTADLKPGSEAAFQKMFQDLAAESGYPEIEQAPLIAMGYGDSGQLAWNIPNWNAARTIAAIPIKTAPLPSLRFTGVPLCYLVGETDELPQFDGEGPGDRDSFWPLLRNSVLAVRASNPANLVSMVTDPGGGHFDWSERQARFVALYIRKACRYRLPADGSHGLQAIDPLSGWLTDSTGTDPERFTPAPYAKYKGDPKQAYWFFDAEMARAAALFAGDGKARERQMLTFVQDGEPLPVAAQGFAALRFEPESDGLSFRVAGTFLTQMPQELMGGGAPLGHAAGPITFRLIAGPAVQAGRDRFRVQFNRGDIGGPIWIQEEHPGDVRYRHAVQPGQVTIPARLTQGKPQTITFPRILNQRAGEDSVELRATSDSKLPVEYYVVAGPAEVDGHTLRLTAIPVRSRYPVKVTVVAYQWGRTPAYRSADPVEQTFLIDR